MEPRPAAPDLPAPRPALDLPALVRCTHDLLRSRVPLTLLLDVADAAGPRSHDRYVNEGGDASSWLPR